MASWEAFDRDTLDKAGYALPGEQKNRTVTPFFRYESILNEPKSKLEGKPVHELKEVVEVRFAANSQYKPVFGVDEMCEVDENTGRVITWAERFKPQYQAFLAGTEQIAEGTPLEELLPYGISQAQLSMCRALNIHSVQALANLPPYGVKKLGANGNSIIPMAKRYLEDVRDGSQQQSEINELKRQLAELQAANMNGMGEEPVISTQIPEVAPVEEDPRVKMKDEIERLTGARPRGNPSEETLALMLEQAQAA